MPANTAESIKLIDFKEIATKTDDFELFAREFLKKIGAKIIVGPGRGADGGSDLIVEEIRSGVFSEKKTRWLVSCKHYAHSGKSVGVDHELNILERLEAHECNGFLGFYSTIASSALVKRLEELKKNKKIEYELFDNKGITGLLWGINQATDIIPQFFPVSYTEYLRRKHLASTENQNIEDETSKGHFEDHVKAVKTAMILLKIDEITTDYFSNDQSEREAIFVQLLSFERHTNLLIEERIFDFLDLVSSATRSGMSQSVAISIFASILTFSPRQGTPEEEERISLLRKRGIGIGYNIAYDAFIHLGNLHVAMYGLQIIKFFYREAKRQGEESILKKVRKTYNGLRETLNRPERSDLEPAKEILAIFQGDLDEGGLSFPVLPSKLYQHVEKDR